jgi:hypothetical protein
MGLTPMPSQKLEAATEELEFDGVHTIEYRRPRVTRRE